MKSKAKKIMILAVASVVCAGTCLARPHGGHGGGHHHHHGGGWGRGGRNFWPGFVGGIVGGALYDAVATPAPAVVAPAPVVVTPAPVVVNPPAVVTPPPVVVTPQPVNVWVPGRYVDQVQADGSVIRVWQPGHYEQR